MLSTNDVYYNTIQMINAYVAAKNDPFDNWHIKIAEKTIQDPRSVMNGYIPDTFYQYAGQILLDCLEKMDKTRSGSGQLAAIKRVIKNSEKNNISAARGIFREGGSLWITDSYVLFKLSRDLPSVLHSDETERIIPAGKIYFPVMENATIPVDLPDVRTLKLWIRENERNAGKRHVKELTYNLGNVYVNPYYLLNVLEAVPECEMFRQESNISPLFFKAKDESISGILCPCRPPKTSYSAA